MTTDEDEAAGRWLLAKGEAAFDALYEWMTTVPVVVPDAVMTPLREIKEVASSFRRLEEKTRELEAARERVMECLRAADPPQYKHDGGTDYCDNEDCQVCHAAPSTER